LWRESGFFQLLLHFLFVLLFIWVSFLQCPFSGAGEPTFGLDSWRTFCDPEGDCEMNLEGRGMEAMMATSSS